MPKALIVSGDESTRYLYQVAIAYQKIEVSVAKSVKEAITEITKNKFDIVILDLETNDIDQVEELKSVSKNVESMPVIIITDMENSTIEKEASVLGACKFMVKGENSVGELIKNVRKVVSK